jgi:bifunctional UDP-N-acetylglucosamine pyrophosphorylase/glucosamine-1-phosphate N-acetyltransferase
VEPARVHAIVLAAGRGTRTRSAQPKALLPLLGLPLVEHALRSLAGVEPAGVVVVVGHGAEAVEQALGGRTGLSLVRQEPPLGTGDAVRTARAAHPELADRTQLVVNGDLPLLRGETLARLVAAHREKEAAATLLTAVVPDGGPYGRILRDERGDVARIVEAGDASPDERRIGEINAGAYVFDGKALGEALERLEARNAQGEYYLTDVVAHLRAAGRGVIALAAADAEEVLGVNTLEELADVTRRLRERRLKALMDAGVRIEDPQTTHVGLEAVLEPDAVVRPFTFIEGRSLIRSGATVGPFARLLDVELGRGAQVLDHCLLRECSVEEGASVGPFTHVRPQSRIGAGARVGNFVELKKTALGSGAKAQHLSYLGDATVGAGANIGAGTITCNYDGVAKHETRIEAGAFVGSDTTLVAPVVVGEGAYIAAGSTITEDVPKEALALGRARQVTKQGWVARRREQAGARKARH